MHRRALAAAFVVVATLSTGVAAATPTAPQTGIRVRALPEPKPVPSVAPDVTQAALRAPGSVVRSQPGVTVTRVRVGSRSVFRVRVAGNFPPRALRYVVSAGGDPVGYGIPTPAGDAVQTVTTSASVLSTKVTARSEARPFPASGPNGDTTFQPGNPSSLAQGPFDVSRSMYNFGDRAFQPLGLGGRVEVRADVHFPKGLHGGPFPLILFLHGNHEACYLRDKTDYRWPCKPGWHALPNYLGYDYIAERLASFGYVVVSISGNGVNVLGNMVFDTGMRQRGLLIEHHIDMWRKWNAVGGNPFGTRFVGKIDMTRIGVMGHSRGGEGAVWSVIVDRQRTHPYGIDAILPLAPVDFTRRTVNDIPMAVMLPFCDGDVSDLQGVHFFDDARYRVPGDPTPKHTITVFGANHNFFNTVWTPGGGYPGGFDDTAPGCRDKLNPGQERHAGSAYIVDFFRRYVGGETSLDPFFTGQHRPPGAAPARTLVSYLAPDAPDRRLDVDRFDSPNGLGTGQTGGSVTAEELVAFGWCADTFELPCVPGQRGFSDVHLPGLGQGVIGWSTGAIFAEPERRGRLTFELPPGSRDVSGFDALQLRAGGNFGYTVAFGTEVQNFVVGLRDGSGNVSNVPASLVGNDALEIPTGRFRHFMLNQIRFPLERFHGVDLTDVVAVQMKFAATPSGVIDLTDLAFSRGAA